MVFLVYHGFNGNSHPIHQPNAVTGMAVIGHLRIFVKFLAYPMAHKTADNRETVSST